MKKNSFLLSILFCVFGIIAKSQTTDLAIDRPRHSLSVITVAPKWLLLETGLSRSTDNYSSAPYKNLLFEHPSFLMRYGLLEGLELRLISDVITQKEEATYGDYVRTGMRSIQIGGKAKVLKQNNLRPALSIMAYYRINDLNFLRLKYDTINGGGLRFALQNKLNEKWFIDYNVGIDWLSFRRNTERYMYSLSPVFLINERWRTYIEASGFIWSDVPPVHFLKIGIGYQVTANSSLNIFGGKSWNTNNARKPEVYSKSHIVILYSFKLKTSQKAL